MKAVWMEQGRVTVRDGLAEPACHHGHALIAVRRAAICGTDLALLRGYADFAGIPGHEFAGEVIETTEPAWKGARVVADINLSCGRCVHCLSGRRSHCARRRVLGIRGHPGAFAERLVLPLENLHRIPDTLDDDRAVFAEPLAAALQITRQVDLRKHERVLVIGAGRLGQLIVRVLLHAGCELAVVARHAHQRELLELAGAEVLDERAPQPCSYDLVVEATGAASGVAAALRAVRPCGTVVLKSSHEAQVPVDLGAIVVAELTVLGSRCGPVADAVGLLAARSFDPTLLIDARYPLDAAHQAFAHAAQPGVLKVLLEPA